MNTAELYSQSHHFLQIDKDEITLDETKTISDIIAQLADYYYNNETPIIADSEYDELLKLLEYLELKYFITDKKSQAVGSNVKSSSLSKVKHSRPMTSLGNTYNEEDLKDFDTRINRILGEESSNEYMIEFKFDGLGVELVYKKGKLVQAITRGDGIMGEDVTANIFEIDNIPKTIDYDQDLEVRGEVLMPISSFENLNNIAKQQGTKIFSNPRNAASGSLRVLDANITKQRNLKFFAYDVGDFEEFSGPEAKYDKMILSLKELGFDISSYFQQSQNIDEVIHNIHEIGDIKSQIDFEIDGLVIKINDINLWKEIGYTEHHPRYAIAYKFPAEIVTTTINEILHSVGRTGTITPVAILEPVNIGGAIISRSTLHNYDEIDKLGVHVGDKVFIKRAGEVIPKVISVIENARTGSEQPIYPPKNCPSCGHEVQKDEDKVRYYCPNWEECPAQLVQKYAYIVGKNGFDIDGFGIKQVELFLEKGYIKNIADIFLLENYRNEILQLEGYKQKSVDNLLKSIQNKKNMPVDIFIRGLAIKGVGKKTAKLIAPIFEKEEDFINFDVSIEELESINEIGPELAKNIYDYFTSHKQNLKNLLSIIDINFPEKSQNEDMKNKVFYDKKVCITGSFENYKRDELVELLEKNGGSFVSSVSKNTDFLLAGDKAGSKLTKANKLQIPVLNIDEFMQKIKQK